MTIKNHLACPKCQGRSFQMKKEATYLYTYELDTPLTNEPSVHYDSLPFLFDKRDMLGSSEYIQCKYCGQQYFYDFTNNTIKGELTTLKKAVMSKIAKLT